MSFDFTDRVVVVSGAAQGLGRAMVRAFADVGALAHAVDIDAAVMDIAAAEGVNGHVCDIASGAKAAALMHEVLAKHGRIDALVNAAGGVCGQTGAPVEMVSEADWRAVASANVDTAFFLARAAAGHMKSAGYGRMLFIASGAGLRASLTGIQAYAAAKHAVVGLTRQLALELGPHGVTVNALAPGFVRSNPATEQQWQALGKAGQKALLESIHTRRLGTPADIANAALFLCAKESSWVTGQVLSVDGGRA